MVQDFSKGAETTGKVNYGEYVIIDTFDKNNVDNGKVFRRGMNFTGDLGGAEYIGQIVGPQGGASDIDLVQQDDVPEGAEGGYQSASQDKHSLIPGQDGTNYNDKIYYKYKDFKDDNGVISTFKVGFQIPYLVHKFTGAIRSPYESGVPIPSSFDLIERTDDGAHPFYQSFKINVPQGFKGDTSNNFKIFPTVANVDTEYQANKDFSGISNRTVEIKYIKIETQYEDQAQTPTSCVTLVDNPDGTGEPIGYAKLYGTSPSSKLFEEHLIEYHLGYLLTNYETSQEGVSRQIDLGPYKDIDNIDISATGVITITYTCGSPHVLDTKIKYPTALTVNDDGTITTTYNRDLPTVTPDSVVKQITNVRIENQNGEADNGNDYFRIYYNNGENEWVYKNGDEDRTPPINFIDTAIVNHINGQLLVRYSNPASRGTVNYTSQDETIHYTDQKELGLVKGDPGGIRLIGVDDITFLYTSANIAIPPENLDPVNSPHVPAQTDPSRIGQCAAVGTTGEPEVQYYDYNNGNQHLLASVITSAVDPQTIIGTDSTKLLVNGVQLVVSQRQTV